MKYVWKITTLFFLTTMLLSCQAVAPSTPVPQEPAAQTESPDLPTEPFPQTDPTQALTPLPQEEAPMTPVTPPNESAERLVTLVKQHLSQRLRIAVDQIVLSDVKPVVWRDASLGCPKPGVDYIQVETPGYNILLEANGKTYTYHTDETRRIVQCNK